MPKILKSYPAFEVLAYEGENLADGAEICLGPKFLRQYKMGSVMSYAGPEAVERAKAAGQELQYIFGLGACITSHQQARKQYVGVEIGQAVMFEGAQYEIVAQPNQNLGLRAL